MSDLAQNLPGPSPNGFAVTIEPTTDGTRVRIIGELDLVTAPELSRRLGRLRHNGQHRVLLDLADLQFVDSSGLAAILRAKQTMEEDGSDLTIACCSSQVRRVLELTGLVDEFSEE